MCMLHHIICSQCLFIVLLMLVQRLQSGMQPHVTFKHAAFDKLPAADLTSVGRLRRLGRV